MAGTPVSRFDLNLERASKFAGILVPVLVAVFGAIYTNLKDTNDKLEHATQVSREEAQKQFDQTQRQYTNLSSLLPLLTSDDEFKVSVALAVFTSEAKKNQAPLDLKPTIEKIPERFPQLAPQTQNAATAADQQEGVHCLSSAPAGLYLHVANDSRQFAAGQALAARIAKLNIQPPIQGVQRIDKGPDATQFRYYVSPTNDTLAAKMLKVLKTTGISSVQPVDLSPKYLKPGCTPPAVFELWIGTSSPLAP